MAKKKKIITAAAAVATAAALLLSGTFAWQSINQTALNEASDVINPGGRLHDDFNGTNKDVYVENFADEPIYARIQLSEYFEIIANYGKEGAQKSTNVLGSKNDDGTYNYELYKFDGNVGAEGAVNAGIDVNDNNKSYWTWQTGGSTVYMPTFNMNKDSMEADINGIYEEGNVGTISNRDGTQYTEYTPYTEGATEEGTEIYDGDTNMADEVGSDFENLATYEEAGNIVTVSQDEDGNAIAHTAQNTLGAALMSMADWIAAGSQPGEYWVYDTDGWVYWAQAIKPDTATGLLLTGIELNGVMDDTWYYAINVVAQFVTADDVGKSDNTGFYAVNEEKPTAEAETLLKTIGVQMDGEATDPSEPSEPEVVYAIAAANANSDGFYGGYFADNNTYNLTMTKDGETLENVTWSMELVEGGTAESNNTLDAATAIDPDTGVVTVAADETTYGSGYTTYHVVEVTATAEDGAVASEYFVICNYGVSASPKVVNVDGSDITGDILVGETYKLILDPYECGTNQRVGQYIDDSFNSQNTTFTKDDAATDAVTLNDDGTFVASESGTYRYEFSIGYFSGSNGFAVAEASSDSGNSATITSISVTNADGEAREVVFEDGRSPYVMATDIYGIGATLTLTLPDGQTADFGVKDCSSSNTRLTGSATEVSAVNSVELTIGADEQGVGVQIFDVNYYNFTVRVGDPDNGGFWLDFLMYEF